MPRGLLALLLLPALGGCYNEVWFSDDVDLVLDFEDVFDLDFDKADAMHTPYVQGAEVRVRVHDDRERPDLSGHTLVSLDPSVFQLDEVFYTEDYDYLSLDGYAVGAGITDLVLYDESGDEVDRTEIEVAFPDEIELHAAGPRWVDHADVPSLTQEPTVLVGGLSTYLVHYYEGGRRLYGNGPLGAQGGEDVEAEADQTYFFENREWLRLTAWEEGTHDVGLYVDGQIVDHISVHAVPETAIDSIEILGESTAGAEEGDWLVLLGQAWTSAGVPVYGVEYSWDVDGTTQWGEGDLYRYAYDPTYERDISAAFGDLEAWGTIYGSEGYVDSSNNIGCSTSGSAAVGFLALLPLLGLTRRRRS